MTYPLVLGISMRTQLRYIAGILTRNLFFVMQMFIFASIWRVVFADTRVIAGFTMVQCVWYFSLTEVVELGKAKPMNQIQAEVKEGSIAYNLLRPYNYVTFHLFQGLGESLVSMVPLLFFGHLAATLLGGVLPGYWTNILPGLVAMIGAVILALLIQIVIGLLSFWIEECTPVYWIVQKLVFILGGLFFPIDFFPEWLAGLSKLLPFAHTTYWPAKLIVEFSLDRWLRVLGGQIIYILIFLALAQLLFRAGMKRLESNGG